MSCVMMGVVGGSRVGNTAVTPPEHVIQLIGEQLDVVSTEVAVIPQQVVVTRTTGALDGCVGAQIEVVLSGVSDDSIYSGSRRDIAAFPNSIIL